MTITDKDDTGLCVGDILAPGEELPSTDNVAEAVVDIVTVELDEVRGVNVAKSDGVGFDDALGEPDIV